MPILGELYPNCHAHDHWHDGCFAQQVTLRPATYEDYDNGPTWAIECNRHAAEDVERVKCPYCGTGRY